MEPAEGQARSEAESKQCSLAASQQFPSLCMPCMGLTLGHIICVQGSRRRIAQSLSSLPRCWPDPDSASLKALTLNPGLGAFRAAQMYGSNLSWIGGYALKPSFKSP